MAAADASARGQRAAILASPLHELIGFYLAVDCRTPGCNGEWTFAVAELASFYGRNSTVGQVLRCASAVTVSSLCIIGIDDVHCEPKGARILSSAAAPAQYRRFLSNSFLTNS